MTRLKQLNFYAEAPDVELRNTLDQPVKLSSLWAEKTLVLAFTRHFGCTQCKEMLAELVAAQEQIRGNGMEIAVVTQGTPAGTAQFAATFAPGLDCLSDPERKAYQAYGLTRGTVWQTYLNRQVWAAIKRATQKGFKVEPPPPGQDAMQMSGTFIINTQGRILLPFYYDNIADHPSIDLFLNGVLNTKWDKNFEGPIGPYQK